MHAAERTGPPAGDWIRIGFGFDLYVPVSIIYIDKSKEGARPIIHKFREGYN